MWTTSFRLASVWAVWPVMVVYATLAFGGDGRTGAPVRELMRGKPKLIYGWAVCGRSSGKVAGYEWYPEREGAESAKRRMEGIEASDGKFFDRVEIRPEKRPDPTATEVLEPVVEPEALSPVADEAAFRLSGASVDVANNESAVGDRVVSLEGTSWRGNEAGHELRFVFRTERRISGFDQYGEWTGTWKMVSPTRFTILFTQPTQMIYVGQIGVDRIAGLARNPGTGSTWGWGLNRDQDVPSGLARSGE